MDGLTALSIFNLGYRYGNLKLCRAAIEVMKREGFPCRGFEGLAEELWGDIPAAQDGWAIDPAPPQPTPQEEKP